MAAHPHGLEVVKLGQWTLLAAAFCTEDGAAVAAVMFADDKRELYVAPAALGNLFVVLPRRGTASTCRRLVETLISMPAAADPT